MGKGKKRQRNLTKDRDIDKSMFVSNVLLRARLARPCSYCHVPYHHRLGKLLILLDVHCEYSFPLITSLSISSIYKHEIGALCLMW